MLLPPRKDLLAIGLASVMILCSCNSRWDQSDTKVFASRGEAVSFVCSFFASGRQIADLRRMIAAPSIDEIGGARVFEKQPWHAVRRWVLEIAQENRVVDGLLPSDATIGEDRLIVLQARDSHRPVKKSVIGMLILRKLTERGWVIRGAAL